MQQQGNKNLLGEYAAINYHEFWAVAVETFFENPVRFKHELPDLYEAMVRLLISGPAELCKWQNNDYPSQCAAIWEGPEAGV